MEIIFNADEMLVLLQDFHRLTGLRAAVFDRYAIELFSYPPELPAYCKLVRSTTAGREGCRRCDRAACARAAKKMDTLIYPCHAGLLEVITPIQIDGSVAGFLLLAHIVQGADETAEWEQALQRCAAYSLPQDALAAAYQELPRTSYPRLRSAANLLALAASALCQKGLARLAPDSLPQQLNRYLSAHLTEPLNSAQICDALSISRTSLYYLCRSTYGCGINEQITRLRIQKAMRLLAETQLSNAEVCYQSGFQDENYFYRVFRRQTGQTPRQYRACATSTITKTADQGYGQPF